MRKLIITLLLFIPPIMSMGGGAIAYNQNGDQWIIQQQKIYPSIKSETAMNEFLKELHKRFPKFEDRLRAIALIRIGTPYVGGCLGEEKEPDKDPIFKWDVADCTTFVITNSAIAHKDTVEKAKKFMEELNYYNPPTLPELQRTGPPYKESVIVSFENRLHFTEERLHGGSKYFEDITEKLLPKNKISKFTLTLNKKSDGTHLLDIPWEKEVTVAYIPSSEINEELLKKLPLVCGVAFVKKKNSKIGIFVSHEAMIIDRKWIVEADTEDSLGNKKAEVQKEDFLQFYNNCKDKGYFDGIIIYEFK